MSNLKYQCAECGAPIIMLRSHDTTIAFAPVRECEHKDSAIAALLAATVVGVSKVAAE